MSVIAEPETPAAAPAAEEPITMNTINEFNKTVEAGLVEAPAEEAPVDHSAEIDKDAEQKAAAAAAPAEDKTEEEKKLEEGKEKEGEEAEKPADAEAEQFKLGADVPFEEFKEQKAAYLETVEVTPELQAILDRQEAELTAQATLVGEIDAVANKDMIFELASAVQRAYSDVDVTEGEVKINATPIREFFQKRMPQEVKAIAEELFGSDSTTHKGLSLVEEIMVDKFGLEKAQRMMAYGFADAPLPVVPQQLQLPAAIDEKNKEAYLKLHESERFEIQSMTNDIIRLQDEAKDASEWRKEEIGRELSEIRGKLNAKVSSIEDIQQGINATRETAERIERQQHESAIRFRSEVNQQYNTELFGLVDTFAQDLAPRLTYADTDTQLSQARNILTRVNNALGFIIEGDGSVTADPMADFYAKQLLEEGVKFDFAAGRSLLEQHYRATEKLAALKARQASPQAIEIAQKAKNKIMFDIKTEQKQLLGQLSAKYVKSNGAALGKQIDEIKGKKQAVKAITNGKPHTKAESRPIEDEIMAYNRGLAATTGEELFDAYQ